MSKDLDETLAELGPEYRELVGKLRMAYSAAGVEASQTCIERKARRLPRVAHRLAAFLIAASVMIAIAATIVFAPRATVAKGIFPNSVYTVAYGGDSTYDELVRTQNGDGSWQNDYITRQNAAALRAHSSSSVAYRKAIRYLRSKGLAPISDTELRERSGLAAAMFNRS